MNGTHQCDFLNFCGGGWAPNVVHSDMYRVDEKQVLQRTMWRLRVMCCHCLAPHRPEEGSYVWAPRILAEGAIALSVTLSGGALFASWKLLQFPSSLIVKVILAIFMGASVQLRKALALTRQEQCYFLLCYLACLCIHLRLQQSHILLLHRRWLNFSTVWLLLPR